MSAPEILQREIEKLLNGLLGTDGFYDNDMTVKKDVKEVSKILYKVLERLNNTGLTVKKENIKLYKDSVTLLGYYKYKNRLTIRRGRIKVIINFPIPTSIQELKNLRD